MDAEEAEAEAGAETEAEACRDDGDDGEMACESGAAAADRAAEAED